MPGVDVPGVDGAHGHASADDETGWESAATIDDQRAGTRSGTIGGVLTFFAVGCPVCNKLVLVALGSAGVITWFEPVQPLLQVIAVALLTWALFRRLEGERSCRPPRRPAVTGA